MKPMTKKMALENALTVVTSYLSKTENSAETVALTATVETIEKMVAQLSTPVDEEKRKAANEARKAATAEARKALVEKVAPVLRKYLTTDLTAKEVYEAAKGELPTDFSPAKVQNILLREMKDELVKVEAKGKANTYRVK